MSLSELMNVIKAQTRSTNALIDLLNQALRATETSTAFVEQRNMLSNNAAETAGWTRAAYKAKAFARGCRGFVDSIEIYARNRGPSGTITLGVAAEPEGAEQFEVTIIIPPDLRGSWYSTDVGERWHYWGMFIYVKSVSGALVTYGYDAAEETPDGYTSPDTGTTWVAESNRRYWVRVNQGFQSLGEMSVGGHVTILEMREHIRVVGTDEDGNVTGVLLPLYNTTIIGSDEVYFNDMTNTEERQKSYNAGDPFTSGWSVGKDFYPSAVTFVIRADHDTCERPPCLLEYEGVYIQITSSDGQQIFTETLGTNRNIDFDLITWEGHLYWIGMFQKEINYRKIETDVSITVLVKNSSGKVLNYCIPFILGTTIQ
ncbi:hypothetical protein ES703_22104 [subsurface metagenome]